MPKTIYIVTDYDYEEPLTYVTDVQPWAEEDRKVATIDMVSSEMIASSIDRALEGANKHQMCGIGEAMQGYLVEHLGEEGARAILWAMIFDLGTRFEWHNG